MLKYDTIEPTYILYCGTGFIPTSFIIAQYTVYQFQSNGSDLNFDFNYEVIHSNISYLFSVLSDVCFIVAEGRDSNTIRNIQWQ